MAGGKWPRASKSNPCPLCDSTRLCHVLEGSKGGRCYRPDQGKEPAYVHERGNDGTIGDFVVWYTEAPNKPDASAPQHQKREEIKRARPEDYRPVYARALELCLLTPAHRDHLTGDRRLSDGQLSALCFGSLPGEGERAKIALALHQEFGEQLFRVPGFVKGADGPTIVASGPGIIIPHIIDGHVEGLQLRLDTPDKNGLRYKWISGGSNADKTKGASIFPPAFVAEPASRTTEDIIVTEGAFKALAAAEKYGATAIGVPGIGSVSKSIDLIEKRVSGRVLYAPDADHAKPGDGDRRPHVFHSSVVGLQALWKAGLDAHLLRWVGGVYSEDQPKGLDDAIEAGLEIQCLGIEETLLHFKELAKILGQDITLDPPPKRKKPTIVVNNDRDPENVDSDLIRYLKEDGNFFSRGGKVVCVTPEEDSTKISIQTHETLAFRIPRVVKLINRKPPKNEGEDPKDTPIRPNRHLTGAALVGGGEVFPRLHKVLDIPFFDKKGRLVQTPGYDPGSFIYYAPALRGIRVDRTPAKAEVLRKLAFLNQEFFREFAFAGEADRCHGLCALLQPFMAEIINARSPGYLFRANQPDSGKTFLAQCIGLIAFGGVPEVSEEVASTRAQGTEMRKLLDTNLIDGAQGILIDNIESDLNYPWLFQYLTSRWLEPRILGKSEKAKVPNRILWMITANTPNLKADAVRRLVPIKFDLGDLEGGYQREFERDDLGEWIIEHRRELIEACLTLVAGWVSVGSPRSRTAKLNSYSEWASSMGGLMEYLDVPGFLSTTRSHRDELDEAARLRREIIDEIVLRHGLVRNADTHFLFRAVETAELVPPQVDLNGSDKRQIQQFAKYLKRIADTTPRVGAYRLLRSRSSSTNSNAWTIEKIEQSALNNPEVPITLFEEPPARIIKYGSSASRETGAKPEVGSKSGDSGGTSGKPPELPGRIIAGIPEVPEVIPYISREREEDREIVGKHIYKGDIASNLRTSGTSGMAVAQKSNTAPQASPEQIAELQGRIRQIEAILRIHRPPGLVKELAERKALLSRLTSAPAPALAPPPPPTESPTSPRRSRLDDPDEDDLFTALDEVL